MKNYTVLAMLFLASIININASNNNNLKKYLIPIPKNLNIDETVFKPNEGRIIAYNIATNLGVRFSANHLQKLLEENGFYFSIAGNVAAGETPEIELIIDSAAQKNEQGYTLIVSERKITITANNEAGLYYGVLTLGQIAKYAKDYGIFPQVNITDYPDFKKRGITIDISRNKVPSMASLYKYIDMFASWKINEIQLYTEHTFQYKNHKKVWQDASALSSNDIIDLDKYCSDRFIDLVPNQNGFGHMERWLEHKEYWHLAENETIVDPTHHILGIRRTISAVDKSSIDFINDLYNELLPNFSSENVNIGGDEPYELGTGKSKKAVSKKGKGQVYLDFLLKLNSIIVQNGKKAQFWGDIILEHPELIKDLPKNITCMIWGYKWNHPFNEQAAKFNEAKIPFYVCPGTSSWRSIVGRTDNALKNQINAAENGIKYGALGYLNTDWGDDGHPQPYICSYAPYVFGAALSWSLEDNRDLDINYVLNNYVYKDPAEKTSQVIFDMGNINQITDKTDINNYSFYSILYYINKPMNKNSQTARLKKEDLIKSIDALNKIIERVETCRATSYDSKIIYREIKNASKLAIHACKLGIAKIDTPDGSIESVDAKIKYQLLVDIEAIIAEYKEVWMLRNQIGGLTDSLEQLLKVRNTYLH
tara:strand:- start:15440 stop:17386 length:1947 start_codon:yes stop_codon:yes gene_type:complete